MTLSGQIFQFYENLKEIPKKREHIVPNCIREQRERESIHNHCLSGANCLQ